MTVWFDMTLKLSCYLILKKMNIVLILVAILRPPRTCGTLVGFLLWSLFYDGWQERSVSSKMPWCCCQRRRSPQSRASSRPLSWPTQRASLCWSLLRMWMERLWAPWCSTGEIESLYCDPMLSGWCCSLVDKAGYHPSLLLHHVIDLSEMFISGTTPIAQSRERFQAGDDFTISILSSPLYFWVCCGT